VATDEAAHKVAAKRANALTRPVATPSASASSSPAAKRSNSRATKGITSAPIVSAKLNSMISLDPLSSRLPKPQEKSAFATSKSDMAKDCMAAKMPPTTALTAMPTNNKVGTEY